MVTGLPGKWDESIYLANIFLSGLKTAQKPCYIQRIMIWGSELARSAEMKFQHRSRRGSLKECAKISFQHSSQFIFQS